MKHTNELSIFIDESGDFGKFEDHCPFYIVSMIFHNQAIDISESLHKFEQHLSILGFTSHAIHTAPLIRQDTQEYKGLPREIRRSLFNSLFNLFRKLPINFLSVVISKEKGDDEIALARKITRELKKSLFLRANYINSFDKIVIYYDNGQVQLTKILTTIFEAIFDNVEIRKVKPADYILFQIADLICTLELSKAKLESCGLSKSEENFYMGQRNFKKNLYKYILKKRL